ncbi:MAG: histidinol-phosphatase HisJ family protein [Anaerolineae bacterium]|nr:histidinol-phosphatase HisJ family protein [Anaerolineae bacterium]
MLPPDYHIHTRFSCDSQAEMDAVCRAALARGLREIALTDHVDFGPADPPDYFRPSEYFAAIERCRERYGDRLTIRAGAEVGEPHLFDGQARAALSQGRVDFIIGSAHYADGLQVAWEAPFFEQPLRQAYEAYFLQVVRVAAEGDFDVLGHLDLVKRDAYKFGKPYDGPEPYADMIRTALRYLVERGKGLEINTSPLRRGMGEPCPSLHILRWYRELGGEIITIGSDAHTAEAVGADFELALEIARSVGFTRLATFEERRIVWREIER